jgi:hypothetical protein
MIMPNIDSDLNFDLGAKHSWQKVEKVLAKNPEQRSTLYIETDRKITLK